MYYYLQPYAIDALATGTAVIRADRCGTRRLHVCIVHADSLPLLYRTDVYLHVRLQDVTPKARYTRYILTQYAIITKLCCAISHTRCTSQCCDLLELLECNVLCMICLSR
jgi:hypothetical protein